MKQAALRLRSFVFVILFYGWTLFLQIALLWVLLLPRKALFRCTHVWQRQLAWLERTLIGIDYEVRGLEHVPPGACIIAAKHESAWETCKLHLLFGNPAIVLKEELARIPVWGWYGKATGMIPIDRGSGGKALNKMKREARRMAAEGRKIVIFPQGTRVLPGERKPYKVGVAVLYQELGLPVVPMALNSGLFWPKTRFIKTPGHVTIEFLPPIPPGLSRSEMMRDLESRLEAASDRLAEIAPETAA
jgi:1-acyl-sn-glycerol-3-phosphate acyltransferase